MNENPALKAMETSVPCYSGPHLRHGRLMQVELQLFHDGVEVRGLERHHVLGDAVVLVLFAAVHRLQDTCRRQPDERWELNGVSNGSGDNTDAAWAYGAPRCLSPYLDAEFRN